MPANSTKIKSVQDLEKPGTTIAIGSATVPIGSYTRQGAGEAGAAGSKKILANVRSEEPDVSGIVGKLTQGAVDAGFTYVTDVKATKGALRAIALPASLQPVVAYGVGGRQGRTAPRSGAGVHLRAAERRRAERPADGRVPSAPGAVIARRWFPLVLGAALAVTLAFLVLPVVAIFTHTAPHKLI